MPNSAHFSLRADSQSVFTAAIDGVKAKLKAEGAPIEIIDNFGGGGYSAYAINGTFGNLDIRTPLALFIDELTARTNGNYGKLGFNALRLQRLTDSWSLYASINGQFASQNLDISDTMELGGL